MGRGPFAAKAPGCPLPQGPPPSQVKGKDRQARVPKTAWLCCWRRVWLFTLAAVSGILSARIPVHIVSLNLPRAGGRYGGTDCRPPCATRGASPHVQWSRALPSPSPSANLVGVSGRDNTYGFHV